MRCIALMRNVNQGQRGHPSTADILAGFADAGCPEAQTFQSNGTVLFDARSPARVVERAEAAIAEHSGHERDIFWISLATLLAVVGEHGESEAHGCEFTLHAGGTIDRHDPRVVKLAAEHRCSIVDAGPGWALVRNHLQGEGHATPVLERLTGSRATSRGLPTLVRLAARFGGP